MSRPNKLALAIVLALLLAGCKETVLSDLGERDANEIVAVLYTEGIAASKEPVKDGRFAVSVSAESFSAAVAVLSRAGLPRQTFDTLGDVFPDDNVVGTPFEERARFSFALSQELSETITEIDGVKYARVHVVIPEKPRFGDKAPPAKAAVAVYHKSGFDASVHVPKIKLLVAFAVPDMTYDDVSVSLFPAGGLADMEVEPARAYSAASAATALPGDLAILARDDLVGLMILAAVLLGCAALLTRVVIAIGHVLGRLARHVR